jgi:hypothetical protein
MIVRKIICVLLTLQEVRPFLDFYSPQHTSVFYEIEMLRYEKYEEYE